jgi:molybdenum-dependent DNA-binding transcriptional regulator ModE
MTDPTPQGYRRDGWTPVRQLRFLEILARTGSVTRAAAAAGMSRESAYRLRRRSSSALFAAAWDRALKRAALSRSKGHKMVDRNSARRRDSGRETGAFPPKWAEDHEMHGPPDPLIPGSSL